MAVDDGARAVDVDPVDAECIGVQPGAVAGQVVLQEELAGPDRLGVEDDEVGVPALGDPAALHEAEEPGRYVGHVGDGTLHGGQLLAAQAVGQPLGGVAGAGHPVEVGAGVRTADHHVVVVPGCLAHDPAGRVVVGGARPQHGAQVVGQHDVQQRVEVSLAPFTGDVSYQATLQPLVGLRVGVADPVQPPAGESREHAGVR